MAVTEKVSKIALEKGPAALEWLKQHGPDAYNKAKEVFATGSGGGDILVAAQKAVIAGDVGMARAVYDSMVRSGVKYDRLQQVLGISAAQLQSFVNTVEAVERAEVAKVETQRQGPATRAQDAAKAAEATAVCKMLDVDTFQLKQLLIFLNTTSVSQITDLELAVTSTSPLLPFVRHT